MKKYCLDFCFKGDRKYVQGPDIFDAVIEELKNEFNLDDFSNIKYSAYGMLHSNADLILVEDFDKSDYDKINSIITFQHKNKKYHAVVIENASEIECSNKYSEDVVRNNSIIDSNRITFQNELSDSITEIIVSMNKYFLQETVTKDGKWIVTKFEYEKLVDVQSIQNQKLILELKNNFNNKLTKSTVYVNNTIVGNLYFSLI